MIWRYFMEFLKDRRRLNGQMEDAFEMYGKFDTKFRYILQRRIKGIRVLLMKRGNINLMNIYCSSFLER
jgi:hypothetical protein